MSQARQAILARLRAADVHTDHQGSPDSEPVYTPWQAANDAQRTARFCEQLTGNHAEIYRCTSGGLTDQLRQILKHAGARKTAAGTAGDYRNNIEEATRDISLVPFDKPIEDWKASLFADIDAGITHVHAAIADTGTLVLRPDETEPRTLSLVPPCHIAIVNHSSLTDNFAALMDTQHWQQGLPTNVVLISGPSKTADIQQTLAYGAHGPRRLIVILLEDK
ncbi:LutC/YkgG family protein [Photobacterium salinisoli]|uniref:LutC/YkgG family protein n=1 Tax=Photobacterium salinisoli TaxID=1616783 RepID=UPI000EA01E7A|nr:lactate utilization protein C [Photobacterium salinisoli]